MRWLLNWILHAAALLIVAHFVAGFHVASFGWALVAALVYGIANATIGLIVRVLTFPLTILTLGIFWLVVNALMLELTAWLTPGFRIDSFWTAFVGAVILAILNLLIRAILPEKKESE